MSARQGCLPPEGCDGGFHWIRYSGTPTLALWMPADANQPRGCWRSFGGREFEPDSKIGRAHTYLGPVAAWNHCTPAPLPTRDEVARVVLANFHVACLDAPRCTQPGCKCATDAADAVMRLLGGERSE